MKRRAAIAVCGLSLLALAAAQKGGATAAITGKVVDEAGATCPNVHVVATNPAMPKKHWDAVSDPMGEFAITLPAGNVTYLVETNASRHYAATQLPVTVVGDEKVAITITLHIKS